MSLQVGARLGSYEVLALIGSGGMGEVYRAKDTKLGRDVAIKVLPDAVAGDPDRLARFHREAQVLASLNHPNIAHIHGYEDSSGVSALVMELVEGPTLADRIAQGAIPLAEVLPIAKQIAEALETAHEQGIIHRDLKPANIKVREDGTVKVLDFGLAKLVEPGGATQSGPHALATASPTLTTPAMMTGVGVILGTAAYMSPEQAKGRPADKRSDVWAFGCVLFEMLTGRRAFEGEDVGDTLANVLKVDPDWDRLPRSVPEQTRLLLKRCLERDRGRRLSDVSTVRFLLSEPLLQKTPAVGTARGSRRVWLPALFGIGVGLAIAFFWVRFRSPVAAAPQVATFGVQTSAAQFVMTSANDRQVAISPDGSAIVYVGPQQQLMVRRINELDVRPLAGLVNARAPTFSADGKWIAFEHSGSLQKISVNGGAATTICKMSGGPRGLSWVPDGTIIFATSDTATGLMRVSASGGDPKVLTTPAENKGEADHLFPALLPNGAGVLYTITHPSGGADRIGDSSIAVFDIRTGRHKVLLNGGSSAEYIPGGYLVYASAGGLQAVRFDVDRLEIIGEPVQLPELVASVSTGATEYSVSSNGTLVYLPGTAAGQSRRRSLVWVDRQGRIEPLAAPIRSYQYPTISPDGTRIAVSSNDQDNDVWVWDNARQVMTRLTFEPKADANPMWTPDGRTIIFSSNRNGAFNLYRQPADGTGTPERLTTSPNNQYVEGRLSPDGTTAIVLEQRATITATGNDLLTLHLSGDPAILGKTEPLIVAPMGQSQGQISPDGHWFAYMSNESGQQEVYVRPFPDANAGKWQVSSGGSKPVWTQRGNELIYAGSDGWIMSVPVKTTPTFAAGAPTRLFQWRTVGQPAPGRTYDVTADGQRFLMIREEEDDGTAPWSLVVVLNWTEELKRLVSPQ